MAFSTKHSTATPERPKGAFRCEGGSWLPQQTEGLPSAPLRKGSWLPQQTEGLPSAPLRKGSWLPQQTEGLPSAPLRKGSWLPQQTEGLSFLIKGSSVL